MGRADKYRIARSFGTDRRHHAFDLAWGPGGIAVSAEDEDFGPSEQERAALIAHFAQSHVVRTGGELGGRQVEAIQRTDPRTRAGFDAAVYLLPPPWLILG